MDENAKIVLDAISAVEERDAEKLFGLHHDEVEFYDAPSLPYGGVLRGNETLKQKLATAPEETWLGTWGPLQPTEAERRMDPRVIAVEGEEVVVIYRQRAVSSSGERFDEPVLAVYEVRDGKFARAQMFHYDTAAVVAFLERAATSGPSMAA